MKDRVSESSVEPLFALGRELVDLGALAEVNNRLERYRRELGDHEALADLQYLLGRLERASFVISKLLESR